MPGFRVDRLDCRVSFKVLDDSRMVSLESKERDFIVSLKVSEAETKTAGKELTVMSALSENNK